MPVRLRRHDLAYLRPGAEIRWGSIDAPAHAWLCDWIGAGKPLVVTRQEENADVVRLGAVLPTHLGRRRLDCSVAPSAIVHAAAPLAIAEVLDVLPETMVAPLQTLSRQAHDFGMAVGVYGSTAWQRLSGEAYRHTESDVDLACAVGAGAALLDWLSALAEVSRRVPARIDGEIRFPDDRAVAWRELLDCRLDPTASVLVKDLRSVALVTVGSLMESLG